MSNALELDKYFTKEHIVKKCLETIDFSDYDFVIEPSAGSGAFFNNINHLNKIGLDISPESDSIIKSDWLKYEVPFEYKNVLVIGNPPFGKLNLLSTAFIKYSLSFPNVKTIAFVLPNVYRKHTRQKIFPKNWRIKTILELGRDAFTFEGATRHVPCSFFVFDKSKGVDLRVHPNIYKDKVDFIFSDAKKFDIFMFGASPKRIITDPKPNNRGHFMISKINVEKLVSNLREINWQGNSCANGGVYWLNQTEVINHYYNQYCKNV